MRPSFRRNDAPQNSINQQQGQIREARPTRYPIAKWILCSSLLFITLVLVIIWWKSSRIYAKGVVTAQLKTYSEPLSGSLSKLQVHKGDQIRAGDLLYIFVSEEYRIKAERLLSQIQQNELILADLTKEFGKRQHTPDSTFLDGQKSHDNTYEKQYDSHHITHKLSNISRNYKNIRQVLLRNIRLAKKTLTLKTRELQRVQDAFTETKLLLELTAATSRDLQKAQKKLEDATLVQAQTQIEFSNREAQLLKHKITYDEKHNDNQHQISKLINKINAVKGVLRALTQEHGYISALAGPNKTFAEKTGTVIAVPSTDDEFITANAAILSIASTDTIWIDSYIPSQKIYTLDANSKVTILDTQHNVLFTGEVTDSRLEVAVPDSIRELDPSLLRATKIRIHLDDASIQLPVGYIVDVIIH